MRDCSEILSKKLLGSWAMMLVKSREYENLMPEKKRRNILVEGKKLRGAEKVNASRESYPYNRTTR